MTASPKMDDDGLSREQAIREAVARGWCDPANSHKEMDAILAESIVREVCALESRSEVLEDETAWLIERGQAFNQSPPIWWKFDEGKSSRPNAGYASYEERWTEDANCARRFSTKEAAEAYAAVEISNLCLVTEHRWLAASIKSPRAEPGAPHEYTDPSTGAVEEHGPTSAAPEPAAPQVQGEGGDCRPMPDPGALTGTLPSESPVTAAASDVKEWAKRVCDSTNLSWEYLAIQVSELLSSSHARGLEEASKVCEGYYDEPDDAWRERQIANELAAAIRAKIKPTRGET